MRKLAKERDAPEDGAIPIPAITLESLRVQYDHVVGFGLRTKSKEPRRNLIVMDNTIVQVVVPSFQKQIRWIHQKTDSKEAT